MSHLPSPPAHLVLGTEGEKLALEHLVAKGYRLVERNFATQMGEVDLIVEKGDLLAFVEVRYRGSRSHGGAEATVSRGKQRRVVMAAMQFLAQRKVRERALRFDVVAINGEELLHLENAFDAGW